MLTAELLAELLVSAATGLKDERAILQDALLDVLPADAHPEWAKKIADRVAPFSVYTAYTYEEGGFSWWPPTVGPPDTPYVILRHIMADIDEDFRRGTDSPMVGQTLVFRVLEYSPTVSYEGGTRPWRCNNRERHFYIFDVTVHETHTSWERTAG